MTDANFTKRTWILLGIFVVTAFAGLILLNRSVNQQSTLDSLKDTIREESSGVAPKRGTTQQLKTYYQLVEDLNGRRSTSIQSFRHISFKALRSIGIQMRSQAG